MRIALICLAIAGVIGCIACYFAGLRAGGKYSPNQGERLAMITYAVEMYRAAETTNFAKLHHYLDIEILALTRDYETRYGIPSGPDPFAKDFRDAKVIADRLQKDILSNVSFEAALRSRLTNQNANK